MPFFERESLKVTKDKTIYKLSFLTVLLYTISLFYNLEVPPLFSEEPRRALVALEMLLNENYIVTTLLDETFYDHPPLWNIVLAGSFKLFGFNTFAMRFPSALSLLLTGILLYIMGKKYMGLKFGILSALYYLIAVDLYFYFSITAETDIFYSLLVVLIFFSIFHFYQKKQFYALFGWAYFFTLLAFLTKGFASFAFVGLTLFAYFIYKKDFKRLFTFPHIFFGLLAVTMVALYFYVYGKYENVNAYISEMWALTGDRTLLNDRLGQLLKHIFIFPLNFIGVIFPTTLFLLFLWKKGEVQKIKEQPFLVFLTITFFANFAVYLISPGARIRYTYMFFPLIVAVLTYPFYLQLEIHTWRSRIYHTFFQILMGIGILVCLIVPFIDYFSVLPHLKYTMPIFALLIFTLFFLHLRASGFVKNLYLINFIVLCRLVLDHVALPIKSVVSSRAPQKRYAQEIRQITGDKGPIYVFSQDDIRTHEQIPFRFYETATFLEMLRGELVIKTVSTNLGGYYILNVEDLHGPEPLYIFSVENVALALVKLE